MCGKKEVAGNILRNWLGLLKVSVSSKPGGYASRRETQGRAGATVNLSGP